MSKLKNTKFELTKETQIWRGITLFRIKAKTSFGIVSKGELGGWVEKEDNLSVYGDAWVYGDARVYGDAQILWISKIGSRLDTLTAYVDSKIKVRISVGCWSGTVAEFAKQVKIKHKSNLRAEEYALVISLIKFRFAKELKAEKSEATNA